MAGKGEGTYKASYKSRDKYLEYKKNGVARWRKRTGCGMYEPKSWTTKEDRMVLEHSIPDRELSVKLGRSVAAIITRRHRINSKNKGE